MSSPAPHDRGDDRYVVVARRYRPQAFTELVGQDQVAHALSNAIQSNRVGHAYLFTGARGVGKTSTARIFAKALNCQQGPTPTPCNQCDICQSIAAGGDVDVLEIDGASNRGIDEIRQLRSNVGVRPSRARFKVYIIDEVHMLTKEAFNALLKTLEEPPAHVKFIFCTTDPEKIPITVLSRCQRFDFPPVETAAILDRLREIAAAEGVEAEDDALRLLARRANGSMRDSQSLLEQLLSFCERKITSADVQAMLGAVGADRLQALVRELQAGDIGQALHQADRAIAEGVDPSQLTEQLAGWFRDMLAAAAGCSPDLLLHAAPEDYPLLAEAGQAWGVASLLGGLQILDETLVRMRQSPLARTLLEVALVRLCKLEELQDLAELIEVLRSGEAPPQKKSSRRRLDAAASSPAGPPPPRRTTVAEQIAVGGESPAGAARAAAAAGPPQRETVSGATLQPNDVSAPAEKSPPRKVPEADLLQPAAASAEPAPTLAKAASGGGVLDDSNAETIWLEALETMDEGTLLLESAREYHDIAISAPNTLAVRFLQSYNWHKERCERPDGQAKLEEALQRVVGRPIRVEFQLCGGPARPAAAPPAAPSRRQLVRDAEKHPWVSEAVELFGAEVTRVSRRREN